MTFTLVPAWGMSNAAAMLVGQNLGAGEPARAEAAVWRIGWMNMGFTLAVSVLFFVWHDAIIGLFTDDPAVVAIGGEWLSIMAYSYFVYGWWDGGGAGLQRCRRHTDTDLDQPGVLPADPDPAGMGIGTATGLVPLGNLLGGVFVSETAVAGDVTLGHYVAKSEAQLRAGWQAVAERRSDTALA